MAITAIPTKTQQTQLVGPTVTQTAIEQQVVTKGAAEDQPAGADITLGVFTALGAHQAGNQKILLAFVLNTQRHLRQLVVNQVAKQAQLEAEDILAQAVFRQIQVARQGAQIKTLTGVGQLDTVIEGYANTGHIQAVISGFHPRSEYIRAPLAALAIAGQHRPGCNPATCRTFNAAGATRGQQAAIGPGQVGQQAKQQGNAAWQLSHGQCTRVEEAWVYCAIQVSKACAANGRLIR